MMALMRLKRRRKGQQACRLPPDMARCFGKFLTAIEGRRSA